MTTSALNHAGRHLIEVFLYLQVLDILTTLIGFSLGNSEASPFVRLMVHWGPFTGLVLSKIVAAGLATTCLLLRRRRLILWINYWYAAIVVWNLYTTLRVLNV
ncbi:MAG TPA: DUF5658 family protein [Bryobacteraceae bacterium]|nr:DUF5658 family protein [Bryobacteraceae bacterium]